MTTEAEQFNALMEQMLPNGLEGIETSLSPNDLVLLVVFIQKAVDKALLPCQERLAAVTSQVRQERDDWRNENAQVFAAIGRIERALEGLVDGQRGGTPSEEWGLAATLEVPEGAKEIYWRDEVDDEALARLLTMNDMTSVADLMLAVQRASARGFNWKRPHNFGATRAQQVRKVLVRLARYQGDERYTAWSKIPQLAG